MTWVVPLALGGLAIVVMAVFTMVAARRRLRAQDRPATQTGPRVLVHDINDDRCTGCDACVAVCPTNVLDLVDNKSRVLRFHDCIQCEACMWACPTEALVMFPEGSTPPPLKIPEIDEHFQTAVPGQYLIGEVAGKPLVKNAANLGRMVVEHMLSTGLRPIKTMADNTVDVAIIGSGPGGLSAALTCIQRGLSYVLLEKEQLIASTIARYPKGKLVMVEPYDSLNLSLLPVFDSSKEQLIPIWREVIDRVGVDIKLGESVEIVQPRPDGGFDVKSTVAQYRAQRVVLAIGSRGKPRTLGIQGENLPKVFNLLEDPDEWRGRAVIVVGGGDSAVEAALALADAGAKVLVSYRGRAFNRCQQKNRQAIESYAAQGRIKAKLQSQVVMFDADAVILQMADGGHKKYANDGAFVLIGADPPVEWLSKLGVRFVERHHQYQLGKTDDLVRRFLPQAAECPEDAARAAAQILGGTTDLDRAIAAIGLPAKDEVRGPRKWLRAATSMLSGGGTGLSKKEAASRDKARPPVSTSGGRGRLDGKPVPLSEFAKRQRTNHTGHGRRDALSSGERTRILRMLRDEGGRLADEDSKVFIGAPPAPQFDFELDDSPAPAPVPGTARPTGRTPISAPDAKQAVIVGLAQAMARGPANKRGKRASEAPPPVPPPPPNIHQSAPPMAPTRPKRTSMGQAVRPPPPSEMRAPRRPVPPPFSEEPTRQVDDGVLDVLRSGNGPRPITGSFDDASTRHAAVDARIANLDLDHDETRMSRAAPPSPADRGSIDELFGNATDDDEIDPGYLVASPSGGVPVRGAQHVTGRIDLGPRDQSLQFGRVDELTTNPGAPVVHEEATAMANIDGIIAMERASARHAAVQPPPADETTRAVDIRNDQSLSDIDWDID